MGIEIVLKIAGIGMLVAVSCQLLKQTGRDDIAMLAALMGLVVKWGIFWVYMALVAEQIAKSIGGVRRLRSRQWINDLTRAGIQEETS